MRVHIRTHDATNSPGRLAQFKRLVEAFERDEIEAGIDLLIAALDARDGDTDLEPTGDEADVSWPEVGYTARRQPDLRAEDDEDDDPAEEVGDERDTNDAEDEALTPWALSYGGDRPGCAASDPGDYAYPERIAQPSMMTGGLAGDWWRGEDMEPWHLPPIMGGANVLHFRARRSAVAS